VVVGPCTDDAGTRSSFATAKEIRRFESANGRPNDDQRGGGGWLELVRLFVKTVML
jgi:hypothetical protein